MKEGSNKNSCLNIFYFYFCLVEIEPVHNQLEEKHLAVESRESEWGSVSGVIKLEKNRVSVEVDR